MTQAPLSRFTSGLLLAAAGSIAFSGKAIIVKLAYLHGVDGVTLLMFRMVFALPFFLAFAWWAGRGKAPLTRSDWLGVVGLGFSGYYLSSYLDFLGLQYVSASFERLILYLNPTLVLLLGWVFYKISYRQAVAMAVSYGGVLLVFVHEISWVGENVFLGAGLVFLSAVSYAVYLTYSGHLVQRLGSLRLAGLATTVACFLCILQFAVLKPVQDLDVVPEVIWLSLINAIACTVLPVLMVMMAIERLGASLTSQIGMIGPLSTLTLAAFFLGEPLTVWILMGTALVLGGVYWFTQSPKVAE